MQSCKILVVSNDSLYTSFVVSEVSSICEVQSVENFVEAMERVKAWQPDLVIVSHSMPTLWENEFFKNVSTTKKDSSWVIRVFDKVESKDVNLCKEGLVQALIGRQVSVLFLISILKSTVRKEHSNKFLFVNMVPFRGKFREVYLRVSLDTSAEQLQKASKHMHIA